MADTGLSLRKWKEQGTPSSAVLGITMSSEAGDVRAIEHLKEAIDGGKHWYLALLEAIELWSSPEECYDGRHRRYLIGGEAFDWLALAERLCEEVAGLVPEAELTDLLFRDRAPVELTKDDFKKLIGESKYKAYLNYLYGVLVEEVLLQATTEEIRKTKRVSGLTGDAGVVNEAYRQIYGASEVDLLDRFRREKRVPRSKSLNLGEAKEFTYWLFKLRLHASDKSRAASDTKKAIAKLHHDVASKGRGPYHSS